MPAILKYFKKLFLKKDLYILVEYTLKCSLRSENLYIFPKHANDSIENRIPYQWCNSIWSRPLGPTLKYCASASSSTNQRDPLWGFTTPYIKLRALIQCCEFGPFIRYLEVFPTYNYVCINWFSYWRHTSRIIFPKAKGNLICITYFTRNCTYGQIRM